jgi:hypothetical protein
MTEDGDKSQQAIVADGVEALKREVGAATDSELASLLGIQRSAVAQWRRRSKVPEKARLKVKFLVGANLHEKMARERAEHLSAETLIYGRALALSVIALKTGPFALQADFEALWFRRAALTFDRSAIAAAEIIAAVMEQTGGTAWDAYRDLLGRAELRTQITAKAGVNFAPIDL